MSHFYGTVNGQAKGTATRQGTKKSGLVTFCASYCGAVRCTAYCLNKIDYIRVEKTTWKGIGEYQLLYDGPIGDRAQDAS